MKPARYVVPFMMVFTLVISPGAADAQSKKATGEASQAKRPRPSQKEISEIQAELIQNMKVSREGLEKLLAAYEEQLQSQMAHAQAQRKLYREQQISKEELERSEYALASTRANIREVRRWIEEDDIALAEALAREEIRRLAPLARGGYSETRGFIRYNGGARWSLADAGRIEKFFSDRFSRLPPVSAMGQTPAHDRMRFDHHDAMDIAVHPDSEEGRALMAYLRQAGIPFMAFRNKVPGSSTGAHIHIGKPSTRNN
jgi:hypothetical protein